MRWPNGALAAVSLTFDDARESQLDIGAPILAARGIPATFYVSLPSFQARADDWSRMAGDGHEIGNHTATHPCSANRPWSRDNALEDYTLEAMDRELAEASAAIERIIGSVPSTFAYPCGQTFIGRGETTASYVPLVARRFLAGRGYLAEDPADPSLVDLAQVPGVAMDCRTAEDLLSELDAAADVGAWLVLVAHGVAESRSPGEPNGDLAVSDVVLDAVCERLARDPRMWGATVRDVAAFIARQRPASGAGAGLS